MARGGIYKAEVIRARDRLRAMGRYPSIDAVRQELGNTGSKATIHRYLKEIEEEEGGQSAGRVAVSEAVLDLVGRLAERLHEEANGQVNIALEQHREATSKKDAELAQMRDEYVAFQRALEKSQASLTEEQERHEKTAAHLKTETVERARLQQQVIDLQDRLTEEAKVRKALESNHSHAREALEHFRHAAKEQREQEQRQHEQQVQYFQSELKQLNQKLTQKLQEATHANQENARLAAEVARIERVLHDVQPELSQAKTDKAELDAGKLNEEVLRRQVVEQASALGELKARNLVLEQQLEERSEKLRQQEIELATAKASTAAQEGVAAQIKHLVALSASNGVEGKGRKSRPTQG